MLILNMATISNNEVSVCENNPYEPNAQFQIVFPTLVMITQAPPTCCLNLLFARGSQLDDLKGGVKTACFTQDLRGCTKAENNKNKDYFELIIMQSYLSRVQG